MGKKKGTKSKRAMGSLPRGLVHRKGSSPSEPGNPFEMTARMKRPKHPVLNRPLSKPKSTKHALESFQRRQIELRSTLKSAKKANVLLDRRIGEYDQSMSASDQMLARLVKERTRQSQRSSKFRLGDEADDLLTHKGKNIDPNKSEAIYSDDEDDYGNLEAVDTELHFGGGSAKQPADPYGGSSNADLAQIYGQRKTELDDLIARRKTLKAEKVQAKEAQIETVDKMDEDFAELSNMLLFRKDQPHDYMKAASAKEEKEMNEWNMEMKQMISKPKGRATDRTKTPEEKAKEEAVRLQALETRRLARMNGDFDEDDLSDISLDGAGRAKKSSKKHRAIGRNPDELSDSESSGGEDDHLEATFTAEGLKYVDKGGKIVERSFEADKCSELPSSEVGPGESRHRPLSVGARVQGNYRAAEQFDGREAWYDGEITKVYFREDGSLRYDVEYADGDFEEDMLPEHVRPKESLSLSKEESVLQGRDLYLKRNKARDRAR